MVLPLDGVHWAADMCDHRQSCPALLQCWGAPWLTGQREVGHLRTFFLPACGSYTCQGTDATEDLGSQQQSAPPCS